MTDLEDGESIQVPGSGSSVYTIKNVGGVYSCSCPAWRNQSTAIEIRTCKHIRKLRGDVAEEARTGGAIPVSARAAKAAENSVTETPVLLAEPWDGVSDVTDWWLSEKLDGVRAYWDGQQFLSRLGNVFTAPAWFTAGLPNVALDGELWLERKQFQRTVSIVRRKDQSDHWRQIRYVVFDSPSMTAPFEERMQHLQEVFQQHRSEFAQPHGQSRCRGLAHLQEELRRIESLGGEGLMLRQPASLYVAGRSTTLLKVKTFHDAEASVIGHQPGAGRHRGRLGALLVQLPDGTQFAVGTGFSDSQRNTPPPIGSSITFRYQELTEAGVPRFPSFVGIRRDEPETSAASLSSLYQAREQSLPPSHVIPSAPLVKRKSTAKNTVQVETSSVHSPDRSAPRTFQYQDDRSDKFWEIAANGLEVTIRYGRTGTNGQTQVKAFATAGEALNHMTKLIAEKTAKGYVEQPSAAQ